MEAKTRKSNIELFRIVIMLLIIGSHYVTNGVYPMRTTEVANCPVCWEELFHKNITGDIEESVLSLENTIEPYLTEYKNKQE